MRSRSLFFSVLIIFPPLFAQKNFDKNAIPGLESVTASDLRAHLTFLASAELEGRETSFRGQKVAAQYIAAVFGKLGLKPIGDNRTFFQRFELDVRKPGPSTITIGGASGVKQFRFGKDFLGIAVRDTTFAAPAIFLGFQDATVSPEQEADLAGKIVVVLAARRTEPVDAPRSRQRRSGARFFRNAAATFVVTDETQSGPIDQQARQFANVIEKGQMSLRNVPRASRFPSSLSLVVSEAIGSGLLGQIGNSFEAIRSKVAADTSFPPVPLSGITVTINLQSEHEVRTSENVIGMLEGSDRNLKNEFVIFTAHYDHVGVDAGTGAIYHGADDDGSGTASILELAEAFAANPAKPKRSVVFMTVAGEEKGLLGSDYYTRNPILPLGKTIANINMDMVGRIDAKYAKLGRSDYVYVIGSDKISTELDSLLRVANDETVKLTLDYTYNDDNDPEQFYRRSDHYNFAKNGVPIVFFFSGIHEDYHRPTDTVEKILFDKTAAIGRLAFATGWKAANFSRMLSKNGNPGAYGTP